MIKVENKEITLKEYFENIRFDFNLNFEILSKGEEKAKELGFYVEETSGGTTYFAGNIAVKYNYSKNEPEITIFSV